MSEFSEGMAVGQSLGNNNNNCCYPMVPAYPMYPGWGMGYGGGMGMGMGGWNDGWWIILLLLCGWGNGNGFGGGNNQFAGYEIGKLATTNDVASGFSTSAIMSNQRDVQLGQQQGFADVQQTLCQGFSGVNATVNTVGNQINQGICNLGYTVQGNFNALGHQISDCCCQTQRAIDGVNYNMAKNTCDVQNAIFNSTRDIIDNQHRDTDRIIGYLSNQEMDRLRSRVQTLETEKAISNQNSFITANQSAQTAELIRRLGVDCPQPSFLVNPPTPVNFPVNSCGQVQFNNGCCNTCCG